ncbi:MAG: cupin domain-containing protein [Candidatus Thorarchaeota archaeon]
MLLRVLSELKEIRAIDGVRLREILNPVHGDPPILGYSLAHAILEPGQQSQPHLLRTASEVYYILSGEGVMSIDNEEKMVREGDAIYIPPGAVQFIRNSGREELRFLCIVSPPWRAEDEALYRP